MPAIPIIGLGISAYSAYKQSKAQGQAADLQRQMFTQQAGLANELSGFARRQTTLAEPALTKAMQHYMTLASGNRNALNTELAPERAGITETYRGAQRGLESSMPAGPARDRAIAEMYRSKAGQLGMLPMQARSSAFGNIATMGQNYMTSALDAYRGAGSALTGASNAGSNYMKTINDQYGTYGDLIKSGTQAGQSVWDWYKRRNTGVAGGGWGNLTDS